MNTAALFAGGSQNAVFAFLVLGAYFISKGSVTSEVILNVMYYIIITPLMIVTLTKIACSGEAEMVVVDALSRIDSIFAISALDETAAPQQPYDNSVVLENVSFRYEGAEKDVVHGLDMTIRSGEHIALVRPSGGGCGLLSEFFPSHVTSHVST